MDIIISLGVSLIGFIIFLILPSPWDWRFTWSALIVSTLFMLWAKFHSFFYTLINTWDNSYLILIIAVIAIETAISRWYVKRWRRENP